MEEPLIRRISDVSRFVAPVLAPDGIIERVHLDRFFNSPERRKPDLDSSMRRAVQNTMFRVTLPGTEAELYRARLEIFIETTLDSAGITFLLAQILLVVHSGWRQSHI